ncbi:hypothetical protein LEP1GSC024_4441, partial [Leptospira noguchii str. 2001034031]
MSLFTCKKYVFLIEKSLPNFSASAPTQKLRVGTQFYREFVVIPTDLILRSKYLWVRLWLAMDRSIIIAFAFVMPNSRYLMMNYAFELGFR